MASRRRLKSSSFWGFLGRSAKKEEIPSSSGYGSGYGRRPLSDDEYESGYGRPSDDEYGSGYGRRPLRVDEYESRYGRRQRSDDEDGSGYGRRPSDDEDGSGYGLPSKGAGEYGSGYGRRPEAEYGSGYGRRNDEYGSEYGRRPEAEYGSGYGRRNDEYGSEYGRPKPEYGSEYGGVDREYGSGYGDGESEYGSGFGGRLVRKEEHSYGEKGGEGLGYGERKKSVEYGSGGSGSKKSDYLEEKMFQKPTYYGPGNAGGDPDNHDPQQLTQDRSRGLELPIPNEDTQPQRFIQDGLGEHEPPTSNKGKQVTVQEFYVEPSSDELANSSIEMSNFSVYSDSEIMVATNSLQESSKIGKGGYGTVYIGKLRGDVVAVKMLDPDNNEGQKVFFLELVALCRMRHPNLVNLIGACFEKNALVYEFIQNGSLEDCLNKRPSFLTWKIRTRIVYDICSALKYLHSKSIIHGDLKPDNVLLDANFNAKLTDFGLCRFIPKGNSSGAFLETNPKGTFAYIDLKFLETGILRPSSDLYSFGVTILKIVTGMPPLGLSRKVSDSDDNLFAEMIDPTAGSWPFEVAHELAYWGLQCCYHNEKSSQLMNDMWISLKEMLEEI